MLRYYVNKVTKHVYLLLTDFHTSPCGTTTTESPIPEIFNQSSVENKNPPINEVEYEADAAENASHEIQKLKVEKISNCDMGCVRPASWRTTVRGETRDFVRILRSKESADNIHDEYA